ncbi:MAG: bifunctional riboflavin kinase/FAD synthetase [Actinobacteria bacterium]|nr:bifunctional riboflavin kinase/FAD synthetase [Actinomycetota bacterium]
MAQIINLADLNEDFFKNSLNILVIGFFDGIHKGHKDIIKKCIKRAKISGGVSIALTFDIPPVNIISGKKTKKLIMLFEEKIKMMGSMGIDYIIGVSFNKDFAGLSEVDFCKEILINKINAREVFIGENFKFGKGAKGDYLFLRNFLKKYNRKVHAVKLLKINNIVVSSTEIRKLYNDGDVEKIKLFLGRYPSVNGIVQKGLSRGASLGFPTANIEIDESYVIPKNGVYTGRIIIENSKQSLPSLINIGNNPTFGFRNTLIEAFILNFSKNIYNKIITIKFLKYLRQEIKFTSQDDLIKQINKDIKKSCEFFRSGKKS